MKKKLLGLVLGLGLFSMFSCSSEVGEDETIGAMRSELISPDCLTLHSPPPYPIVCGNNCCVKPNGTGGCQTGWACSLSSIGFNIYSRNVVGRTCYCIVGGLTYAGKVY